MSQIKRAFDQTQFESEREQMVNDDKDGNYHPLFSQPVMTHNLMGGQYPQPQFIPVMTLPPPSPLPQVMMGSHQSQMSHQMSQNNQQQQQFGFQLPNVMITKPDG